MEFTEVIEAWSAADASAIHPLRAVNEQAYWESGQAQAEQAAAWIPDGGTVVDFGCGEGRLAIPLSQMDMEVVAVDASIAMLQRLRQNMKEREGHRIAAILNSDGLNLRQVLLNAGFIKVDLIVARAVLIHHDSDSQNTLISALADCIRPGGHLVADWPTSKHRHERRDWIDVTTIPEWERTIVVAGAGLELVEDGTPGVWRKQ